MGVHFISWKMWFTDLKKKKKNSVNEIMKTELGQ